MAGARFNLRKYSGTFKLTHYRSVTQLAVAALTVIGGLNAIPLY